LTNLRYYLLAVLSIATLSLCSCAITPAPITSTPSPRPPTITPTFSFPTLLPTHTFTPEPIATATRDLLIGLGDIIYTDNFHSNQGWELGQTEVGGASIVEERLSLAVRRPGSFFFLQSPVSDLSDFFLEVSVRPELCSENDEFGVMYRVNQLVEHYRFTLTCDGAARVSRVLEGGEVALVPRTETYAVLPGMMVENRIAVSVLDDSFQFYINDEEVFSTRDRILTEGGIALFVRSRRSGQTTVSYDDFILYEMLVSPTPDASVSPTSSP
jgi:hypothetical protein